MPCPALTHGACNPDDTGTRCYFCGQAMEAPCETPRLVWAYDGATWALTLQEGLSGDCGALGDGRPWRSAKSDFP